MDERRIFYNHIADDYDQIMSGYEIDKRLRLIFDDLLSESLTDQLTLDVGCGTGWFTQQLIKRGARVTSSDIGHRMLLQTRKKTAEAGLVQCSLEGLGLASEYFDVVLCTEVIEHTPDPRHSVHELLRVLKPGGVMILTVPNRIWHFSVSVADLLHVRPYAGYENWVSRHDLAQWINEAGGQVERIIGFNLFPLFYKPFYSVLDFADRRLKFLQPLMVNIGVRVKKRR